METYKIEGNITYNQADTEDGFDTVDIMETIEAENAPEALEKFLEENYQYDFFGRMTMYDADTRGQKWARYADKNENQFISVDIVE